PKEAVISTSAPSSSSTSTSVPTNFDLEIVQKVFDAATAALHVTIPDLKIDTFCDFSQYKADMQFNERTIYVTDIPLQMKPANIKQVFAKYESITDFKMTVR
ncbi:15291_t:CDS:2, partial [Funneliformis geosporum]